MSGALGLDQVRPLSAKSRQVFDRSGGLGFMDLGFRDLGFRL